MITQCKTTIDGLNYIKKTEVGTPDLLERSPETWALAMTWQYNRYYIWYINLWLIISKDFKLETTKAN